MVNKEINRLTRISHLIKLFEDTTDYRVKYVSYYACPIDILCEIT